MRKLYPRMSKGGVIMKVRMLLAAAFLGLGVILSACDNGATPTPTSPQGNTGGNTNTPAPSGGNSGGQPAGGGTVVVGSKNFAEEQIVGEIYAISLEVAGIPVQRKMDLGATDIAQ